MSTIQPPSISISLGQNDCSSQSLHGSEQSHGASARVLNMKNKDGVSAKILNLHAEAGLSTQAEGTLASLEYSGEDKLARMTLVSGRIGSGVQVSDDEVKSGVGASFDAVRVHGGLHGDTYSLEAGVGVGVGAHLEVSMRDRDKDGNVEICLAASLGAFGKFDAKACVEMPGPKAMPKPRPNVAGFSLRANR
jgi:hypothetical protein